MRYLFLMIIGSSLLFAVMNRDHSRDVVVDTNMGIMWQDDEDVVRIKKSQAGADEYCASLGLAGFDNWRLPTMMEFEAIVDKKNEKNYINRAFKYNVPDGYWSNKVKWRTLWFYADYMHFISGTPYYDNKKKLKYVRCVRQVKNE